MQLGPLGFPELLLLFVVLLIVFGPRRLPEVGRQIGRVMAELRKSTREIQRALEEDVNPRDLDGKSLLGDVRREIERVGDTVREAADGMRLTYYDAAPPPHGLAPGPRPPTPGKEAKAGPGEEGSGEANTDSGAGKADPGMGSTDSGAGGES